MTILQSLGGIGLAACAFGCLDPQVKEAFTTGQTTSGISNEPGSLGAPCVPDDENEPAFAGFSEAEINLFQSRSAMRFGDLFGAALSGTLLSLRWPAR